MSGPAPPSDGRSWAGSTGDRTARTRDGLLIGLTFAAGTVDAVSFLGLGQIFTANMTGNVVFLALAIGQGHLSTALRSGGALIGFSAGALLAGGLLPRLRPTEPWPRQVTRVLLAELLCLLAFAGLWWLSDGGGGPGVLYLLIALSSFGMGLQNAAARHLAVTGLTTTVVTTALTGFMVDLPALGISGSTQRRTVFALIALFSGAAVGAGLMLRVPAAAPTVSVIASAAVVLFASWCFRSAPRVSD